MTNFMWSVDERSVNIPDHSVHIQRFFHLNESSYVNLIYFSESTPDGKSIDLNKMYKPVKIYFNLKKSNVYCLILLFTFPQTSH